jgi:hypothetical protein
MTAIAAGGVAARPVEQALKLLEIGTHPSDRVLHLADIELGNRAQAVPRGVESSAGRSQRRLLVVARPTG